MSDRTFDLKNLKLGRDVGSDETGLDAVPRAASRDQLGSAPLPFHGYDLWNGYEVSYLGHDGKPRRLGRGHETAEDAAENDNRQQ